MVASRNRLEGGLRTSLWLGVMMLLALPSEVGYQDLATLLTRQPVVNRAQKTAFASTFGTIHEAPYNLPEPVGASIPIPPGYMLAGLDAGHADVTASLRDRLFGAERDFPANSYAGPVIDRTRKGDYGVAAKDDRRVALKGDRLKVGPAGETVPGRYFVPSSSGLTTFWQSPSTKASNSPARTASVNGPVCSTRWVTLTPILLHSSMTHSALNL